MRCHLILYISARRAKEQAQDLHVIEQELDADKAKLQAITDEADDIERRQDEVRLRASFVYIEKQRGRRRVAPNVLVLSSLIFLTFLAAFFCRAKAREALNAANAELQRNTSLRRHCERLEQLRDDVAKRMASIAAEKRYLTNGKYGRREKFIHGHVGSRHVQANVFIPRHFATADATTNIATLNEQKREIEAQL